MAATVKLIVRKFVCGNDNYRRALHTHLIDTHPERETIIRQIEEQGVTYLDTAPAE